MVTLENIMVSITTTTRRPASSPPVPDDPEEQEDLTAHFATQTLLVNFTIEFVISFVESLNHL